MIYMKERHDHGEKLKGKLREILHTPAATYTGWGHIVFSCLL
jgi:hypothetical protein